MDPNHDDSWERVLQRADEALYKARTRGRNRAEMADPAAEPEAVAS